MFDLANVPPFRSHPLILGGHAQTLAGVYLPYRYAAPAARLHRVALNDGDQLALHDDSPATWKPGDRVAVLSHGLSGTHASGYTRRAAAKLCARGVRVFRPDLRGCGAGVGLAKFPYHSGQSSDLAAVLEYVARECPGSPVTLVGFSLSGNITLKLLGELGASRCGGLDSAIAVCPPIDLAVCSRAIGQGASRFYDRHFVRNLTGNITRLRQLRPDAPGTMLSRRARSLADFDDLYTAPVSGFGSAANYYRQASAKPLLAKIRWPTLILAATDDPLIPRQIFAALPRNEALQLFMTRGGGHLGFVARRGPDADRRWLDWRIVDWVTSLG